VDSKAKKTQDGGEQQSISSYFQFKKKPITVIRSKSTNEAVAVVLLKSANPVKRIPLPPSGSLEIEKDSEIWNFIKNNMHDMLVFSQNLLEVTGELEPCFKNLKELAGKGYRNVHGYPFVLTEGDSASEPDTTLNRCPELQNTEKRFNYHNIKRGQPTPRNPNDCSAENYVIAPSTEYLPSQDNVENMAENTNTGNQELIDRIPNQPNVEDMDTSNDHTDGKFYFFH